MHRLTTTNRMRWAVLATALTFGASLAATSGAKAVVVDMNAVGQSSVQYNGTNQAGYYGVSLVPPTANSNYIPDGWASELSSAQVPTVTQSGSCDDPALAPDLVFHSNALCWHGGSVAHSNESFAFTWDPLRRYWATTRNYVEQFLSDVASNSGGFAGPFSITPQYTDSTGRAANSSIFGGGCVDYGSVGGATCQFGNTVGSGPGSDYPASGCSVSGQNNWYGTPNGPLDSQPNDICLTDAQIQNYVSSMVTQTGLLARTKPGHTPVVDVLTPAGVETCLDGAGTLCSAASSAAAKFCSYHGQVNVNGTEVAYVVQPWTASWNNELGCDDPNVPPIPAPVPVDQLATDVGARLVSPLSQGQLGAITNPNLSGWFGLDGSEINDNGCTPLKGTLDAVTLEGRPYSLQREFNNAGAIETDPNALPCIDWTALSPTFVAPGTVNAGDVVQLDGSTSVSSLMVPRANYSWSFGDGATGVGPSVVHAYTSGGTYTVTLTVTDRGGNSAHFTQSIQVLSVGGQPVTPPSQSGSGSGSGAGGTTSGLSVRLQLLPQSLKNVLSSGINVRLTSNQAADGIARISIPRSAAKRAHVSAGRAPSVQIGVGTVQIKHGTGTLRVKLSKATAAKLRKLSHVTLTIRLALVGSGGHRLTIVEAGRY